MYPITHVVNKQLLPVYDKPMIYYPFSTLMLAGNREILIISTPQALPAFRHLLGDGHDLGLEISYAQQTNPNGIAEAFIIGRDFIGDQGCTLILGDNIFYGHGFSEFLQHIAKRKKGATICAYGVSDPSRYGVIEFDDKGNVADVIEKPTKTASNWAITGLYFYDNRVVDIIADIKPSKRGELEITDVNRAYLKLGSLNVELMGRGYAWLDTGTQEALLQAAQFVQTVEQRQGLKIACLEEIALRMGFIDLETFLPLAEKHATSPYGDYLFRIAKEFDGQEPLKEFHTPL